MAQHVAGMFHSKAAPRLRTSFWPHEVLERLLAGERRKRIPKTAVRSFLDDLATLPIVLERFPPKLCLWQDSAGLSREHGLTSYNAAYLCDLAFG